MANKERKNALVTGANGFLGSHLCKLLSEKGYRVYALVRHSSNLSRLKDLPVEFVFGSLEDKESLKKPCAKKTTSFIAPV